MDKLALFKKFKNISNLLSQSYQTLEFFFRFAKPRITRPNIVDDEFHLKPLNRQDSLTLEVDRCIRDSLDGQLMPFPIRLLQGMSGQRFRVLLNKLAQIQISGSYLEIGTFKGSTACSALYQNQRSAILVDNWSEFGGPKMTAYSNLSKFCPESNIQFVESTFEKFYSTPVDNKIFLYFYDGGHSLEEQRMAVTLIDSLQFDYLILVVDDFSWETVKSGTIEGLKSLKSTIVKSWTINPSNDDKLFRHGEWHNGYFISLISKKDELE